MSHKSLAVAYAVKRRSKKMAKGGYESHQGNEVKPNPAAMEEDSEMDMVDRVMRKHYSKGGMVANDVGVAEADKLPAEYDDLVLRADDMEEADYTGANSGDMLSSPGEDERRKDMVSLIMASRQKKDKLPRPA